MQSQTQKIVVITRDFVVLLLRCFFRCKSWRLSQAVLSFARRRFFLFLLRGIPRSWRVEGVARRFGPRVIFLTTPLSQSKKLYSLRAGQVRSAHICTHTTIEFISNKNHRPVGFHHGGNDSPPPYDTTVTLPPADERIKDRIRPTYRVERNGSNEEFPRLF